MSGVKLTEIDAMLGLRAFSSDDKVITLQRRFEPMRD